MVFLPPLFCLLKPQLVEADGHPTYADSLQVLQLLPTVQKHVGLIGDSTLTLGVNVSVYELLSLCCPCDGLALCLVCVIQSV